MNRVSYCLLIFLICPLSAKAELRIPSFFSDHMVLQSEKPVKFWGWDEPGTFVQVRFKGVTSHAETDAQGRWELTLEPLEASATGADLVIQTPNKKLLLSDVLVGEVWLASGQSNMVFTMNRVPAYNALIQDTNNPSIRFFNAPLSTSVEPQDDIQGEWQASDPSTVGGFSAVAFFFAQKLHQELGVPIGIIKSAWGGKPVETFTSREALMTLPATKALVDAAIAADVNFDPEKAMAAYEKRLEQWKEADAAWKQKNAATRGRRPRRPQSPKRALDTEGQPGVLFNSMIHPFLGYTIRGAIWYQGEGNAKAGAVPYDQTLPLLIQDWRERWDDDFSFYFVQLANFRPPTSEPGNNDPWPLLQDRMRRVLDTTPGTGMAIINDVGEANDIHPKNKHDVGERLARWALAKDYKRELIYSGPLFRTAIVRDQAIEIEFEHAGAGLRSRDGKPLQRFEIAGDDKVWHWAQAEIIGKNKVSVSADEVKKPLAVRYAWAANPEGANLVNSDGLPTSVFRTDSWDDAVLQPDTTTSIQRAEERRALGEEIRALIAKRKQLEPGSEEFKEVTRKHRDLMIQFRALAPPQSPNR
jgi:sialate O-acetylesterase